MPILVISTVKQKNSAIFPIVEDTDFLGGFRTVADAAERNAIPSTYRKQGMFVWTNADSKLWRLNADLTSWTEFTGGGGGSGTALIDNLVSADTFSAGAPVSLDSSGNLVAAGADASEEHEVYGLALTAGVPAASVDVITSGVIVNPAWSLTPKSIYYLDLGGGITASPPSLDTVGRVLVRIGQARTATSLLVRIQVVAYS